MTPRPTIRRWRNPGCADGQHAEFRPSRDMDDEPTIGNAFYECAAEHLVGGGPLPSGLRYLPLACACGGITFGVLVARHPTDEGHEFRGVIEALCGRCGAWTDVLRILPLRPERWAQACEVSECECGCGTFFLAGFELLDEGYFDEGILLAVGEDCGLPRVLAEDD